MYILSFLAFFLSIIFSLTFKMNQGMLEYASYLLWTSIAFCICGLFKDINITISAKEKNNQIIQNVPPIDETKFSKELNELEKRNSASSKNC